MLAFSICDLSQNQKGRNQIRTSPEGERLRTYIVPAKRGRPSFSIRSDGSYSIYACTALPCQHCFVPLQPSRDPNDLARFNPAVLKDVLHRFIWVEYPLSVDTAALGLLV